MLRKPDQEISVESFGSWPAMVDWDGDGDLGPALRRFRRHLNLRINEGTRHSPAFAASNTAVTAGGKPLQIRDGHCTPVIADWDGDGRWDILSGAATGAVYWFRNVGKPGRPEFAAAVELLPAHKGIGYSEFLDTDEEPRQGIRSQIDVADYNGDGKLDLLVGDFCTYISPREDLSKAERGEVAELRKRLERLEPAVAERNRKTQEEMQKFWAPIAMKDQLTAEVQAKVRKKQEEISREAREQGDHRRDGVNEPEPEAIPEACRRRRDQPRSGYPSRVRLAFSQEVIQDGLGGPNRRQRSPLDPCGLREVPGDHPPFWGS